jgi:hypothetical protein
MRNAIKKSGLEQETAMIKSASKALCAVLLVAGACGAANATVTDLGAISLGPPTPFQGTVIPSGPFLDTFTFTLPNNGGSGYSILNFPLDIPGVGNFNTVFTNMQLVSNADGIIGNADDHVVAHTSGTNVNSLSLTWGPSSGGNMYLTIDGIANGTVGGLYSGAISATVPIPEAATWAQLVIGLGLMGFAMRRRLS